jgi:ElaB/YqjD/DUF883 family membrane-anchored ribosome-binding protein
MADIKNDPNKSPSGQNMGSGSDTASAAKISGTSDAPSGAAGAGQSSTLASHTARPLGGNAGPTGAGRGPQSGSSQESSGSMTDSVRRAAEQAQEKAGETYEQASELARDSYERASSWASEAYEQGAEQWEQARHRSMQGFDRARSGVQQYVSQNPVMVGLIGLAAGLLIGALLPRTRREDQAFGEWADDVREQGVRYARDMAQRGREAVEGALSGEEPRFGKHESELGPGQSAGRH